MAQAKVPPSNIEAEQSVLGAILIDRDAVNVAAGVIGPSDFYNEINGIIFNAMLELSEERKPIDIVTLTAQLKKKKKYTEVGAS
ncbi:MAG: replicative DNA helicase, partial [Patescibacteria group bacterium]|nr:replicative DNA helicase [Patescibacteria group bacterium]